MNYLLVLIACFPYSSALVHYHKLEKGANGCKTEKGVELKVGEYAQNDAVCGVHHCQTKEGDSLILYCQRPPLYMRCPQDGVSTVTDFPQCCWMCVKYVLCDPDGKPIVEKEIDLNAGKDGKKKEEKED